MISCPERAEVCRQTLANLRRTDWPGQVLVFLDQGTHPDRVVRITENARRLIRAALDWPRWTHLLFLEDDLDFNRHLHHNLTHWRPLCENAVTLASLYNPCIRSEFELPPFHYFIADPEAVYGCQAYLIERSCVAYIEEHFNEMPAPPDIKFSRLAARRGPIYYHLPSLVQHVGTHSVWGGHFHQARDFAAEFFSQAPQPIPIP